MLRGSVVFDANLIRHEQKQYGEELDVKRLIRRESDGDLSPEAEVLLEKYRVGFRLRSETKYESTIKVSEVLGPVAFFYERLRNAIDYKGEHLIRRNAIERILKRQIWERPGADSESISQALVRELIWARYLKNDLVPRAKLGQVGGIISKHLSVFQVLEKSSEREIGDKINNVKEWFMGIASAEIEEILDPEKIFTEALNISVYSWFKKNFEWLSETLSEEEKDIQILIAVQRALSKFDKEKVRYHLLARFYPEWEALGGEKIYESFNRLIEVRKTIEEKFDSPIQPRIYRFVQKQAAAFLVLRELIEADIETAEAVFKDPVLLEDRIAAICHVKYDEIRKRVNRGISRSIVYIFLSKVVFALLVEVPFELYLLQNVNYLALGINTVFPPSLMLLVGLSIKRPDEDNTKRIVEKIKSFVLRKRDDSKISFSFESSRKNKLSYKIFIVFYFFLTFLVFTGITFFLMQFRFNVLSGIIFFMFLSLVLLFGYRVKYTASELNVKGVREGFISHLFTNLTLPFLNLGIWLSEGLSKFNFLILIMDFLIEVPFKRVIGIYEEWTGFIRERREEVIEVPN